MAACKPLMHGQSPRDREQSKAMDFKPLPSPSQFSAVELHNVDHFTQLMEAGASVVPHHKQLKKFSTQLSNACCNQIPNIYYEVQNPDGFGRYHPKGGVAALGSQALFEAMSAPVVCKVIIPNLQLAALLHLAQQNEWPTPHLQQLHDDREAVLEEVSHHYKYPGQAEQALLQVLHSGGLPVMHKDPRAVKGIECGRNSWTVPDEGPLKLLQQELQQLGSLISATYPELAESAAKQPQRNKELKLTPLGLAICCMESYALLALRQEVHEHGWNVACLWYDTLYMWHLHYSEPSAELLKSSEAAIVKATGLVVQLGKEPIPSLALEDYMYPTVELPPEFQGLGLMPKDAKTRQPDAPLAKLLDNVLGEKLRIILRYPGNGEAFYAYDAGRGVWHQVDKDGAAKRLHDLYLAWWETEGQATLPEEYLNAPTHDYLLTAIGARAVLGLMKEGAIKDPDFIKGRLNQAVTQGLLAFKDVCARVDAKGVHILPHSSEHYITSTQDYELGCKVGDYTAPPEGICTKPVLDFYSTYWKNDHKRWCAIMAIAITLLVQFRSKHKQCVVGIDEASGNFGKSIFNKIITDVMGIWATPLPGEFLYAGGRQGGKNEAGANELAFQGKFYTSKDELLGEKRMDFEALKEMTAGKYRKKARYLHSNTQIEFDWVALPFLFCNWGQLPEMDCTDLTSMSRLFFLVFEVMFKAPTGAQVAVVGYKGAIAEAKHDVQETMYKHRAAHMWVLLLAAHELARDHGGALSYEQWPKDWRETGKRALRGADPLRDAIEEAIKELVEPGLVVAEGQEYQNKAGEWVKSESNVVDCIGRMELKNLVESYARDKKAITGRSKSETLKKHMDAVMASHGYEFYDHKTINTIKMSTVYIGCRLQDNFSSRY